MTPASQKRASGIGREGAQEPSAVCSGFCLPDLNCSHLTIIHMGPERDHTHVGAEVRDGDVSPASRCLNLNGVVAEVLPLAF